MKLKAISVLVFVSTVLAGLSPFLGAQSSAPLPSWNEGPTKAAIVKFVSDVTTQGSSSFVEPAERIAVFDNDGTLWTEQPLYNQMAFMLDRVKELAPNHPDWKTTQPFKAVLDNDIKALMAQGEKGLMELMAATHSGMSSDEFQSHRHRLDGEVQAPEVRPPLHRSRVSAHARSARLPPANGSRPSSFPEAASISCVPGRSRVYGIPPSR